MTQRNLIPSSEKPLAVPAAQQTAEVQHRPRHSLIKIPPSFAIATIQKFARYFGVEVEVFFEPDLFSMEKWELRGEGLLKCFIPPEKSKENVFLYPKYCVSIARIYVKKFLTALEEVKPDEFDKNGNPLSWVPLNYTAKQLAENNFDDHDAHLLKEGDLLPPFDSCSDNSQRTDEPSYIATQKIQNRFEEIRKQLDIPPLEFIVRRGKVNKEGFVTGRVWYKIGQSPQRIVITTCPNADWAEIFATCLHELAHPYSKTNKHGRKFRETLVSLAEKIWGTKYFQEVDEVIEESYKIVDKWIASCIRSALKQENPPLIKAEDEEKLAEKISKIKKLRAVGKDQLGKPEGITATALANDLVVKYNLGNHQLHVDIENQDQLVDRFVTIEREVWQRNLAHNVASFCNVFSLHVTKRRNVNNRRKKLHSMHFFGKFEDVVHAEYLYSINRERILRNCQKYLQNKTIYAPGEKLSEKTSFCDSAVEGFSETLNEIKSREIFQRKQNPQSTEAQGYSLIEHDLAKAEQFALEESKKRGLFWASASGKYVNYNQAGYTTGKKLSVVRGLNSQGEPRRLLTVNPDN